MKKKLLFVIPSMEAGGGEKSLVTLLNTIDLQKYEIDLILLNPTGIFLKLVPPEINLVALNAPYKIFTQSILKASLQLLQAGKFSLVFARIRYTLKNALLKNKAVAEQQAWSDLKKAIPQQTKVYDTAIGFLEKSSVYFVVDCVTAANKIGFIHNDYNQLDLDKKFDLPYFEKLTTIATVSEQCKTVLASCFPSQKQKVKVIYNLVSATLINKMAQDKITFDSSKPMLLSVGRLHPQKGFDLAIQAAKLLVDKGLLFNWYVIGEGAERPALEKMILQNNLQDHFHLLGIKENPYPYLKAATLYVQPSRYEGKSIAIDEAMVLNKPIVVTNFTTAKDQIEHLKNGFICEMTANDLSKSIQSLLCDAALQQQLSLYLAEQQLRQDVENELDNFYQIVNYGTT